MTHQLFEDNEVDGDQFHPGDVVVHCGVEPVALGEVIREERNYVFRSAHCPGCDLELEVAFGYCLG